MNNRNYNFLQLLLKLYKYFALSFIPLFLQIQLKVDTNVVLADNIPLIVQHFVLLFVESRGAFVMHPYTTLYFIVPILEMIEFGCKISTDYRKYARQLNIIGVASRVIILAIVFKTSFSS